MRRGWTAWLWWSVGFFRGFSSWTGAEAYGWSIDRRDLLPILQGQKRAFVCITGQLHRLELDGKMENLFAVMEATHQVDLAFVLWQSERNLVTAQRQKAATSHAEGVYPTFDHVRQRLVGRFGLLQINEMIQPELPVVNQQLVDLLGRAGENQSLQIRRSRNHIRRWSAYFQCLDMLDEFEGFLVSRYDVVIRVRGDAHVLFPVNFPRILLQLQKQILLVQECDAWGGINDKIAIVARDSAVEYFTTPIMQYYLRPEHMLNTSALTQVENPQTFLRRSYEVAGITLGYMDALTLLAIPVRKALGETTCISIPRRSLPCLFKQLGLLASQVMQKKLCLT